MLKLLKQNGNKIMARKQSKIKILYHQIKPGLNCPDGIAAAWVVKQKYPEAKLVGCSYQSELPEVNDGDKLIIVDFSFDISVINQWRDRSCEVILIDHHKTLVDKLHEHATTVLRELLTTIDQIIIIPKKPLLRDFLAFASLTNVWIKLRTLHKDSSEFEELVTRNIELFLQTTPIQKLYSYFSDGDINFSVDKCGAVLAWEYFFPDKPVLPFLLYVQDRDLWQWKLPYSKQINECFMYCGRTMDEFDRYSTMSQEDLIYQFEYLGNVLLKPKLERAKEVAKNTHWVDAWGYKFLAVELNSMNAYYYNDILEILYTENLDSPFVVSYLKTEDGYKLSFRSRLDSFDCSKLARSLGGGGHHSASACRLDTLPWIK